MQRGARRDHGIDRVLLLNLEINEHRSLVPAGRLHRRHNFGALCNRGVADSVSLRNLGKIRIQQRGRLIIALIEELLPLPNHAKVAVIDDGNVDF